MGGIIRGFVAGAGKGMADASQMLLADKLSKERDEAEYLRRRELSKDEQSFRSTEAEAGRGHDVEMKDMDAKTRQAETLQAQDFEGKQTDKKLAAEKDIAVSKASATGGGGTDSYKKYQELINLGKDPLDAANVAYGADSVITNPKTGVTSVMGFGADGKYGQQFIIGQEKTLTKDTPKTRVKAERVDQSKAEGSEGFNMIENAAKESMKGGLINSVKDAAPVFKAPSPAAVNFLKGNDTPENRKAFMEKFGKLPDGFK